MRSCFLAALLAAVFVVLCPCVNGQEISTRKELSSLIRSAHSEKDYARLEAYYKQQAKQFHGLEVSEKEQMDRAAKSSTYSKYPSEFERSRNLWIYYTDRREQAEALVKLFAEKKQAAAQHEPVANAGSQP